MDPFISFQPIKPGSDSSFPSLEQSPQAEEDDEILYLKKDKSLARPSFFFFFLTCFQNASREVHIPSQETGGFSLEETESF